MTHRFTLFVFMFCSALFASSCFWVTTKSEGETLRNDVRHLNDRVDQIESQLAEEQANLKEMIERARTDMATLDETLTKATRVLARNSADFGADMDTLKNQMREVDGSLAEIRHELEESVKRFDATDRKLKEVALAAGVDLPVDESSIPAKPDEHFQAIKKSQVEGRYGEVRALSKVFLTRYPDRQEADDAQLMIAKSYISQKRWSKALGELRYFTEKYPKSDLTPEVLYEMANAFYELGSCTDAKILIEAIGVKHAKSPFAKKAGELGAQIKKNKGRCTS